MTRLRRPTGLAVFLLLSAWDASSQSAPPPSQPSAFCRAPDALTLFAVTVRHVLAARLPGRSWPVYQVPCDSLPAIGDTPTAILVVDRAFATDQDVLQYGFSAFPFAEAADPPREPNDPFARLGRFIVKPPLSAVPGVWIKGAIGPADTEGLRLAVAAGSVQALAVLSDALCAGDTGRVPEQLLAAATAQTRNVVDYQLYFEAALLEHRAMTSQPVSLTAHATAVQQDLQRMVVPGLRCDVGKRDRFSLTPFGGGATVLTRTAEHLRDALAGLTQHGRADLGQLNLARRCALDAVTEMLRTRRAPACAASDYGLWTRAYAPLLHAAQVKALQASR